MAHHIANISQILILIFGLPSLQEKNITILFLQLPEGLAFGVEAEIAEPEVSKGALAFLAIVVFTIITIYVVHLIMMVSGMSLWSYVSMHVCLH